MSQQKISFESQNFMKLMHQMVLLCWGYSQKELPRTTFFENCQVEDYIFMTNEKVLLDAGELWSVITEAWHFGALVRFLAPREPKGSSNIRCATQEGLGNSKHEKSNNFLGKVCTKYVG